MHREPLGDATSSPAASKNAEPVRRSEHTASPWILALQAYRRTFLAIWAYVAITLLTGITFGFATCIIQTASESPLLSMALLFLCVVVYRISDSQMLETMTHWNSFGRQPIRLRIGLISLFAWYATVCATISIWTNFYQVPVRNLDRDFLQASAKAEVAVRRLTPGDLIIMANDELRLTVAPAQWIDPQLYSYSNCPRASAESAPVAQIAAAIDRIVTKSDLQWDPFVRFYLSAQKCPVRIP